MAKFSWIAWRGSTVCHPRSDRVRMGGITGGKDASTTDGHRRSPDVDQSRHAAPVRHGYRGAGGRRWLLALSSCSPPPAPRRPWPPSRSMRPYRSMLARRHLRRALGPLQSRLSTTSSGRRTRANASSFLRLPRRRLATVSDMSKYSNSTWADPSPTADAWSTRPSSNQVGFCSYRLMPAVRRSVRVPCRSHARPRFPPGRPPILDLRSAKAGSGRDHQSHCDLGPCWPLPVRSWRSRCATVDRGSVDSRASRLARPRKGILWSVPVEGTHAVAGRGAPPGLIAFTAKVALGHDLVGVRLVGSSATDAALALPYGWGERASHVPQSASAPVCIGRDSAGFSVRRPRAHPGCGYRNGQPGCPGPARGVGGEPASDAPHPPSTSV